MVRTGSIVLVAACAQIWAAAKILGVQASVTSQQVEVGEGFDVVVSVQVDGDPAELPWPEVALPEGIVAGARERGLDTRTELVWSNGSLQRINTTVVRYRLGMRTNRAGTFPIGPVRFQGRDLGTGRIVVVPPDNSAAADIRTSTIVASRRVKVGQQVPFTWRLESARPLEVTSFPDLRSTLGQGFYTATPDSQSPARVVQDAQGRSIARMDWKGSVFPLHAGRQNLPSTGLGWKVVEGGSVDPFEAMARGEDPFEAMRRVPKVREGVSRTEVVPLEVEPVPEKGRPAAFQGGVGRFVLEATLDSTRLEVGRSATLVVRLTGNGQPQASGLPVWTAPDSVETYPPQDTWKSVWKDGFLVTMLERRIVLVPRASGTIPLDSVRFAWFDPTVSEFRTAAVGPETLTVLPGKGRVAAPDAGDSSTAHPPTSRADRAWILFGKASALVWSLGLLALCGWLLFRTIRNRLSGRSRKLRALRAIATALEARLARADSPPGAIRSLLVSALALQEGEEAAGWTALEVRERTRSRWAEEAAEDFANLLRDLEAAEFAGLPVPERESRCRAALRRIEGCLSAD